MRFAITGATGLLGGNLAAVLCAQGHEVVATRRSARGSEHLGALPIRWVPGELGDGASLRAAFEGCEGVFHCAAAVSIRRDLRDRYGGFEFMRWISCPCHRFSRIQLPSQRRRQGFWSGFTWLK